MRKTKDDIESIPDPESSSVDDGKVGANENELMINKFPTIYVSEISEKRQKNEMNPKNGRGSRRRSARVSAKQEEQQNEKSHKEQAQQNRNLEKRRDLKGDLEQSKRRRVSKCTDLSLEEIRTTSTSARQSMRPNKSATLHYGKKPIPTKSKVALFVFILSHRVTRIYLVVGFK